jgi:flagellar biosynthesis protein FliP
MTFRSIFVPLFAAVLFFLPSVAMADSTILPSNPQVQISIQNGPGGNANLSVNLQLLILFTVLSVAPSLLIMMTSFVRVIIVLSFLRALHHFFHHGADVFQPEARCARSHAGRDDHHPGGIGPRAR